LVFPKSPALPEFWKTQNSITGHLAIWPFNGHIFWAAQMERDVPTAVLVAPADEKDAPDAELRAYLRLADRIVDIVRDKEKHGEAMYAADVKFEVSRISLDDAFFDAFVRDETDKREIFRLGMIRCDITRLAIRIAQKTLGDDYELEATFDVRTEPTYGMLVNEMLIRAKYRRDSRPEKEPGCW